MSILYSVYHKHRFINKGQSRQRISIDTCRHIHICKEDRDTHTFLYEIICPRSRKLARGLMALVKDTMLTPCLTRIIIRSTDTLSAVSGSVGKIPMTVVRKSLVQIAPLVGLSHVHRPIIKVLKSASQLQVKRSRTLHHVSQRMLSPACVLWRARWGRPREAFQCARADGN